jgi:hypothetical protein
MCYLFLMFHPPYTFYIFLVLGKGSVKIKDNGPSKFLGHTFMPSVIAVVALLQIIDGI